MFFSAKNPRRGKAWAPAAIAALAGMVLSPLVACLAGEKEVAEEAKRKALEAKSRAYEPKPAAIDPEREARNELERREAPAVPVAPVQMSDESAKVAPPMEVAPDQREQLIATYDWEAHFRGGGAISNALKLALAAPQGPYSYGQSYYLYVGVQNQSSFRRVLTAMPACGSLGRTDGLIFRLRADDGTELVTHNRYGDKEHVHAHAPIAIESLGRVVDLINFNELVATSGALFDFVQRSKSFTIVAEVPGLNLTSNGIEIPVPKN